jgi:acyl carrier protein phosphodiesterase
MAMTVGASDLAAAPAHLKRTEHKMWSDEWIEEAANFDTVSE